MCPKSESQNESIIDPNGNYCQPNLMVNALIYIKRRHRIDRSVNKTTETLSFWDHKIKSLL